MLKFLFFIIPTNNVFTRSESDDTISPFYGYIYTPHRNIFGRKNLLHDYAVLR